MNFLPETFSRKPAAAAAFAVLLACLATPARADAIDGQWCDPQGKHMKIDGPTIKTPGGTVMQGDYSRHSFTYTVPEKEAGAGTKIYMSLMGEEELDVHTGSPVAKPVRWKRCEQTS
ncbi:MAG: hypothetical protein AB7F96_21965 [Beijerinckiaceae bacterium]